MSPRPNLEFPFWLSDHRYDISNRLGWTPCGKLMRALQRFWRDGPFLSGFIIAARITPVRGVVAVGTIRGGPNWTDGLQIRSHDRPALKCCDAIQVLSIVISPNADPFTRRVEELAQTPHSGRPNARPCKGDSLCPRS